MKNPELHVPHANRTKPEPDAPWRYVCPNCRLQVHRGDGKRYYCKHNHGPFDKDDLKDKKSLTRDK